VVPVALVLVPAVLVLLEALVLEALGALVLSVEQEVLALVSAELVVGLRLLAGFARVPESPVLLK
jgi:hypothetical protein